MQEMESTVRICMFDLRRGQEEGNEVDKILFFFPPDCPLSHQLNQIGLSEGLITFTKIFSPEAPCELIESEQQLHVFYQCEPDIWMVTIIDKSKEEEELARDGALQAMLKEAHCLFRMFNGPIRVLLEKDPTGNLARCRLHAFLTDYLSVFTTGKKLQLSNIQDSLTEKGIVQMFFLESETALEVQAFMNHLESWFGVDEMYHVLILFRDLLVSTTLPPEDTVNLFTYARLCLTPSNSHTSSSWVISKKSYMTLLDSSLNAITSGLTGNSGASISENTSNQNDFVPRYLQRGSWHRDQDGFLVTDAWGAESNGRSALVPCIWLRQYEDQMHLCVYQQKMLIILILLPIKPCSNFSEGSSLFRKEFLEKAYPKIGRLEKRLTKEWGGTNMHHVPGYRYLYIDRNNSVSRASPSSKVGTLSKESLIALNKIRAEADAAKRRAERNGSAGTQDFEACFRTKNNAWVIVRLRGSSELYMALERVSDTLLLTSEAVERFNKRYCDGIFLSD